MFKQHTTSPVYHKFRKSALFFHGEPVRLLKQPENLYHQKKELVKRMGVTPNAFTLDT